MAPDREVRCPKCGEDRLIERAGLGVLLQRVFVRVESC
jgi:hypothetical protein